MKQDTFNRILSLPEPARLEDFWCRQECLVSALRVFYDEKLLTINGHDPFITCCVEGRLNPLATMGR